MSGIVVPRAVCYRCDKPQAMCLCARIPRVENQTPVLVLQHPRERQHPIGTARFARLGLCAARVEVAWNAGVPEADAPRWVEPGAALLFPSSTARELSALPASERPRQLVVLDGTWRTAASLYRDKAWLRALPHVRLSPEAPSRYRLRKEPLPDYVSTIEAIVGALRVLEPELRGLDELLGAFDAMIDDQLVHVLRRAGPRRERARRPEALRKLPEAITGGFERIVLVQAESVPLAPSDPGAGVRERLALGRAAKAASRALVQVTAQALASGERRQWHLRPADGALPDARMLEYMQLAASDYAGAVELATFRNDWEAYLQLASSHGAAPALPGGARVEPIVAAWNQSTLDLLAHAGARLPDVLVLKSAYRGRCGAQHPSLEHVVAAEGLSPVANGLRGRAAGRIACAVAVAEHLRALAQG